MRLMLKFTIPVETGNRTAKDGSLGRAIEALVAETDAEAAYFTLQDGRRAGFLFFQVEDQAQLAKFNEPFFAAVDAEIDIVPALTLEDLRKGLA